MSGGEQQMLAIGRALMANPKLLLLDEPSMGIAPILVERIYETIAEINKQGTTILLVEQNANFALGVSKRGYVLETGHVALRRRLRGAARQPRGAEGVPGRMSLVIAAIGAKALYLLYAWLASAIVANYLSERKGYGAKAGPGARPAPERGRRDRHAPRAGAARLALEAPGAVRERRREDRRRGARRARGGGAPEDVPDRRLRTCRRRCTRRSSCCSRCMWCLVLIAGRARGKEDTDQRRAGSSTFAFAGAARGRGLHDRARDLGGVLLPEPLHRHGHDRAGDLRLLRAFCCSSSSCIAELDSAGGWPAVSEERPRRSRAGGGTRSPAPCSRAGTARCPVVTIVGHLAVERLHARARAPARTPGGAARGRAPSRAPCWSPARAPSR